MIRTSLTHPIRVDAVPARNGLLGLTFCPGKHEDSLNEAVQALIALLVDAYPGAAR